MKKMTIKATKVAACIGVMFAASGAYATDWNVTQNADITVAAPSITQGATSNVVSSNQALNGIVLDIDEDGLATGSQTVTIASDGVILTQGGNVDNANQALNLIEAEDIGSTSVITQTVNQTTSATTVLTQVDLDTTGNNVQAANLATARLDVEALLQSYTETGNLQLDQNSVASANNTQGVNFATGQDVGTTSLTQSVVVDGRTRLIQGAGNVGGANIQVGNGASATTGDVVNTSQSFTSTTGNLVLRQSVAGVGANIQAANMLRTEGAAGDIDAANVQTITKSSGRVRFTQNVSASNNTQAGNLAISGDNIDDLTQTFNASGSVSVDFDQTPTASTNVQAGNMAVLANAGNDTVGEISQTFTSSILVTDFVQESGATNLIQAGNLIDINGGDINDSGTTQEFQALGGDVSMTQSGGGSANLQAFNAIVDASGNGSGGTVSQQLTITSGTFVMAQNDVTGSGQYGNFVGVKY